MANRPMKLCAHAGCSQLTTERYCGKHKQQAQARYEQAKKDHDKARGNAGERGYDNTWARLRLYKLRRNVLCEKCEQEGRLTPAVLVHHIKPIADGGERLDMDNLMSLCRECHEEIHGRSKVRPR